MEQEEQLKAVKNLIETGNIKDLRSIFLYVKKSQVNLKIGGNYYRFLRYVKNPRLMSFDDVYSIARVFDVTPSQITVIVLNQIDMKKK